jgi:hypothetical protein
MPSAVSLVFQPRKEVPWPKPCRATLIIQVSSQIRKGSPSRLRKARKGCPEICTTGANSPCSGLRRRVFLRRFNFARSEVGSPASMTVQSGGKTINLTRKMSRVPSRSLTVGLSDRRRLAAVTRLRGRRGSRRLRSQGAAGPQLAQGASPAFSRHRSIAG